MAKRIIYTENNENNIYHENNIYIIYHENNVPSRLSPQWLCGTWTHDVRLHIAGTNDQRVLNKISKEHNISGHK